jgi:hypothetical protein
MTMSAMFDVNNVATLADYLGDKVGCLSLNNLGAGLPLDNPPPTCYNMGVRRQGRHCSKTDGLRNRRYHPDCLCPQRGFHR